MASRSSSIRSKDAPVNEDTADWNGNHKLSEYLPPSLNPTVEFLKERELVQVMLFVSTLSYIVGYFGFSIILFILILYSTTFIYNNAFRRMRAAIKSGIEKEAAVEKVNCSNEDLF
jgi:Ca2+-dependent lipid-binding protein